MRHLFTIATFSLLTMSTALYASERLGYDGCYQLYVENTMLPAFCLSGTAEEGIGGAGVRLAMFETNTDNVAACLVSTASYTGDKSFTFEVDGRAELKLVNVAEESSGKSGDAIFGRTRTKFLQIDDKNTDRLMKILYSECF